MSNYTGRTSGGYKGASSTSKATTKSADAEGTAKVKPAFNLSMSIEGEEGLIPLTGVFANTSKAGGEYYSVKVKEEIVIPVGAKLMVFKNVPKSK